MAFFTWALAPSRPEKATVIANDRHAVAIDERSDEILSDGLLGIVFSPESAGIAGLLVAFQMIYTVICLTTGVRILTMPHPADRAPRKGGTRNRPIWLSVYDAVGRDIVEGKLLPGEILPTEGELGRKLRVSRPSLREGLRALASRGLVETRTRRGTIVRPKEHWDILDPDVLAWMAKAPPDQEFLMALLELRTIIEPAAARLAAHRATPGQVVAIWRAYSAMAASLPDDVEACCRHDLALHEGIIAATGNIVLARFAAVIRTALLQLFRVSSNARESYTKSLAEHRAVAGAIRRREAAEAENAMRILLKGTERDLVPAFSSVTPAQARSRSNRRKIGKGRAKSAARRMRG
jgi:DNA-binding FadR family transcriptional regulator